MAGDGGLRGGGDDGDAGEVVAVHEATTAVVGTFSFGSQRREMVAGVVELDHAGDGGLRGGGDDGDAGEVVAVHEATTAVVGTFSFGSQRREMVAEWWSWTTLGLRTCHCLCDGLGAMQFLAAWFLTAKAGVLVTNPSPCWDREILRPREPPLVKYPHVEFMRVEDGSSLAMTLYQNKLVQKCYRISREFQVHLKNLAQEPGDSSCTTFDAMAAHVWRSWVKALDVKPLDSNLRLTFSVNSRQKLNKTPLRDGFYGNALCVACAVSTVSDLVNGSLSKHGKDGSRSPVRRIRGWTRFSIYESADFGWGRPVYAGPIDLTPTPQVCVFLPEGEAAGATGTMLVCICLPEPATDRFKEVLALGANQSRQRPAAAGGSGLWFLLRPSPPRTHTLEYLPQMDFVSRHAASDHQHQPPPESFTSSSTTPHPHSVEEQEYLARYMVVKHSWRGRYKRILCISSLSIITLDPSTLLVTNLYDVGNDFEGAAPILGRDENSQEFNISVRTDGRGKFKATKFSSKYRASILTELHRIRWNRIGAVAEFPVLHLRRRTLEWVPLKMKVTYVGVELIELKSGDLRWCLDFRDMASPAIVLLSSVHGTKNVEHGATEAVQAEETPCGGWSVTRLRSAAHGTLNMPGFSLGVGPKGGLGEQGDAVSRQLILTRISLVERRPDNYEAVIVRPLSSVSSLVRFAEEPQMFAVEFNDGCPVHVYASTFRDSLLAAVRDVLQTEGQCPVPVLPRLTMPGHRIDPPCGRVHLQIKGFSVGQQSVTDSESASTHLKHLAAAAKDAVAEGGSIPGSRAKLWRRIREFNACIPYSGVPGNIEVPEVTLMALITMLPAAPNHPPESPPLPPPSPKAAATVMGFVACLRRLLTSRSAASHVMSFPAAVGRIMGLLRNGSEGVAAEAAGLIAVLIGGGPGNMNVLTDTKGEWHATVMHTKSVLYANNNNVIILVNRLKPMSVSPLLSMCVVEVLEAMICEPHGETTQYTVFVELLRQVAGLRRRLFALFGHPAESVRETVAVIMRTIAEEDAIAAESMRDAALRDGALLRHLSHAFFLPAGERREVSRQLVALWADSYQPALDLLSRVLPPGLVAYLHTRSDGSSPENAQDISSQEGTSLSRRQRILLQQRRGRAGKGITSQGPPTPSVNNFEVDPGRQTSAGAFKGSDSYQQSAGDSNSAQVPVTNSYAVHKGDNLPNDLSATGAPQMEYSASVASPDAPSTNTNEFVESNASNSVDSDPNLYAFQNAGIPAPAQIVVEHTPVGSGRLLCNWPEFWRAFSLDHNRADLIWNERTRQELRQALQAEVHNLDVEKERTEDIVPGRATTEVMTGQDSVPQISWNYSEFSVSYRSLSKEVCVGQYYLRLLLESGNSGRAQDFPLRDPLAFFRALYHRFLCDADTGLTVDGAVPDEMGASDDWCDMGRLDGFGGGGGSSVRELCARAMAIVYEQHYRTIGPFEGTAHITVLLDRTDDRALRHRLLLLMKVYCLPSIFVLLFCLVHEFLASLFVFCLLVA
ncbi:DNAJ heat shock N-terminal domain-containing protein [Actinidia rufa]|uniref:DNAJ heat shock N-terminal domain-containing protein n=1 Tax=Actinidia rufa TaxID=165716 RepID=A0A7J0GB74_9ERIC|nr:DNAJ heat shock N-terminal domain-containing protein [Actinidia rufa]